MITFPTITALDMPDGYQARTLVCLNHEKKYEVCTIDLRLINAVNGQNEGGYVAHMLGGYPFETAVYRLVDINEPPTSFEELFGDALVVSHLYRRDLVDGDLYLSRSRGPEEAALEHDDVVMLLKNGLLLLLTQSERQAIYGDMDYH